MANLDHCTKNQIGEATGRAQDLSRYLTMAWALEMRTNKPEHWREQAGDALSRLAAALGFDLVPRKTDEQVIADVQAALTDSELRGQIVGASDAA